MALNGITFTLGQGGLETPLPGFDYISGYVVYAASAPSGFVLGTPQVVYSLNQAVALGITNTYSDETAATGTITFNTHASTGDVISVIVNEPTVNGGPANVVTVATYTAQSTDTTATILAQSVKAAINANTYLNGYSATGGAAVLTLKARPGLGIAINGVSISATDGNSSSPGVITNGTFSGGVAGFLNTYYYQIEEYFRLQPAGVLWIGFYAIPGTYTFTELNSLQTAATGAIRQFMVYSAHGTTGTTIVADIDAIQAVCTTMQGLYSPASVIYGSNILNYNLTSLSNLRTLNCPNVTCVIGQDGTAQGAYLSLITGVSVPAIGAALGTVSLAQVQQSIAWVAPFNVTNGTEDAVPAFSNGSLGTSITYNEQVALDAYGYVFLINKIGYAGTYWSSSNTSVLPNNDYAYIENNRTVGKVLRQSYTSLVPLENSNLYTNANGTLSLPTIRVFTDALSPNLDNMVSIGNISAYSINIPATQNVLSTGIVNIVISIVPVGVARQIDVTLQYVLSL